MRSGGVLVGALVSAFLLATTFAVQAQPEVPEFVEMPVKNFRAPLSGAEEVPPRETNAQGAAIFMVVGESVHFSLIVANIENVIMAHIHLAPCGENGGIVVWLHPLGGSAPLAPGQGRFDGVLSSGSFGGDALVGALAGMTIADLVAEIEAGNAYVNVHTDDGEEGANTGPGDFGAGEVRGQIFGNEGRSCGVDDDADENDVESTSVSGTGSVQVSDVTMGWACRAHVV